MAKKIKFRFLNNLPLADVFRNRLTRNILAICVIILLVLPFLDIYYIYPQFNNFLLDTIEEETERSAQNLLAFTLSSKTGENVLASFPEDFPARAERLIANNKLLMLKLYDSNGTIIYSTNQKVIGTKHSKQFFYDVVKKGNCITKFVSKATASLEEDFFERDVVESYIPIMNNDIFSGAFEIYHDATSFKSKIDKLNAFVILLVMSISLGLIVIVAYLATKLDSAQSRLYIINQAIHHSPQAVVIFTSNGIIELMLSIRL